MILTCPSCRAQFAVNPNALGDTGRTVRCGKCKHQWLAKRPLITIPDGGIAFVDTVPDANTPPSAAETPAPVYSGLHVDRAQDFIPSSLPAFSAEVQPIATRNAIIAAVIVAGLLSIPVFMVLHPSQTPPAPENPLVEAPKPEVPKEAEKKEVINKEEREIVLDGTPTTLLREEYGRAILNIEGALINKTQNKLPVPVLQAQALNAKGKVVKEWIIPIANKEMEPGQRQSFSYSMPFNEQGVVDIAFHFL